MKNGKPESKVAFNINRLFIFVCKWSFAKGIAEITEWVSRQVGKSRQQYRSIFGLLNP